MVQVTRKDEREANENIIRRFNRKVLQSGVLAEAKASMRFAKPLSKTERRTKAIIRKERKAGKAKQSTPRTTLNVALKEQVNNDLKAALLGGDRFTGEVLRGLKAAILNERSGSKQARRRFERPGD